jgi:hypothetical protein
MAERTSPFASLAEQVPKNDRLAEAHFRTVVADFVGEAERMKWEPDREV